MSDSTTSRPDKPRPTPNGAAPAGSPAAPDAFLASAGPLDVAARIDRLPITRFHLIFLATMGTGFFFDFFDLSSISSAAPVLVKQFSMTPFQTSFLIASGYLGMILSSLPSGYIADRIGRKRLFTITLLIVLVGQLLQASAQNYTQILIYHLIVGIGVGGDVPIIWAYVSEMLPARVRGRWSAFAFTIGVASIPVVAIVAAPIIPAGPDGWRWLFGLGALTALVFLPIRRLIPESPRFLLSVGRVAEAEATLVHIETMVERQSGAPLPPPEPSPVPVEAPAKSPLKALFAGGMRRRTVLISIQTAATQAAFYGITAFLPLILVAKGFSIVRSLEFSAITGVGIIVGPIIGFMIWDRFERRYILIASMAVSAVLAVGFAFANSVAAILIVGFLLFMVQQIAPLFVYTPEIFPTSMRATGSGFVNLFGRTVTVISILIIGSAITGVVNQLLYVAIMFVVAVVALIALGVNTSGRKLEDIAAPAQ